MSSGETAEIKEGTCGEARAEKKKTKEGERERGQGGWRVERGTTNITGGRAAGESRLVIPQDFVIETLFEVERRARNTTDKRHFSPSPMVAPFISRRG